MTVSTTTSSVGPYSCNGSTTEFPVTFPFLENDDLVVYLIDSNGDSTTLTIDTHYTVTGAGGSSGTVTTVATYASGNTILIDRVVDLLQETDLENQATYYPEVLEDALDKLTMIAQQLYSGVSRSIKFPTSDLPITDPVLPSRDDRLGKFLQFDAITGQPIATSQTIDVADYTGMAFETVANLRLSDPDTLAAGQVAVVGGYYAAGDGGGGPLRVWQTSGAPYTDNGGSVIVPTSGDGSGAWVWEWSGPVNVKWFGLSPHETPFNNRAKFNVMMATLGEGTVIEFSEDVDPYIMLVDTRSNACVINKRCTIRVDGRIVSTTPSGIQADPSCIFNISSDDVTFEGSGSIEGDGSLNDVNSGDDSTIPCLLYVTGNRFVWKDLSLKTPPKVGIHLVSCSYGDIQGKFEGGPTVYTTGNTGYFAIRIYLGGSHTIHNSVFQPDALGGMFVNTIFSSASNSNVIADNVCIRPFEKLCYLYGDHNLITGNKVVGNVNIIPGSTFAGTLTTVYRTVGSYNTIHNNDSDLCGGGATCMNGVYNTISSNRFVRCGLAGIAVFNDSPSFPITGTRIIDNVCVASALTGATLSHGILVRSEGVDCGSIEVRGNRVADFNVTGTSLILISASTSFAIERPQVVGNYVETGYNGINLDRTSSGMIAHNYINGCVSGLVESGSAYNKWVNNRVRNGGIGITGLTLADCSGNQYTDAPLSGVETVSAVEFHTVTHGGIAPNALIIPINGSTTAATSAVTKGIVTAVINNDFRISTANGTAWSGGEVFGWQVIQ